MARFVEGMDRGQATLLPECLEDWVDENNPVRAVDVFVEALDLVERWFDGAQPMATGRPGYKPSVLLKCRKMGLLANASVAIDGSKFKAVNSRDNNFTKGKLGRRLKQIEESVARYMGQLDTADRQTAVGEDPSETVLLTKTRLKEKLVKLEEEVKRLKAIEKQVLASPDQQVSLIDPDCRSMATSGRGSGMVAYNVQCAVVMEHHLIVAHEVTNVGTDRSQLAHMGQAAKAALRTDNLDAVADRGYFKGEEILACEKAGITVTLPKPQTSGAKSEGRFGKPDFVYLPAEDVYRCPAGEKLTYRYTTEED